jgi:AcrR family transcriptional regulator
MPRAADDTRRKLLDAATRAFADDGVFTASLLDITRKAGQRNRGALHYHFGSREGVLREVLEQPVGFLAEREREMLAAARARPRRDVESVAESIVRPAAELAAQSWRGRSYLMIMAQLVEEDQDALDEGVRDAMARTGGYEAYQLLAERMPVMSEELRQERFALITSFILHSIGERARATGRRRRGGRPQLDEKAFVDNLVAMVAAMACAPVPAPGRSRKPESSAS